MFAFYLFVSCFSLSITLFSLTLREATVVSETVEEIDGRMIGVLNSSGGSIEGSASASSSLNGIDFKEIKNDVDMFPTSSDDLHSSLPSSSNGAPSGETMNSSTGMITSSVTSSVPSSAHIPLKSFLIKAFPFQVNCIGCNQSFPCYYTPKGFKKIPSPAYYVHCIDECESYRAKELIRVCEFCNFKFLDKEALGIHKNSCKANNKRMLLAQKPNWMPVSIILTIINYSKFDGTTSCRGCKRLFPCYRKGSKVVPSLEYYIHCIEHCKEYREKGWMRICPVCDCKFLNNQALVQHKRGCFKSSV